MKVIHILSNKGGLFLDPSKNILCSYSTTPIIHEGMSYSKYLFTTSYQQGLNLISPTWSVVAIYCTQPPAYFFKNHPFAIELPPANFHHSFPFFKRAIKLNITTPTHVDALSPCIDDTAAFFALVSAPECTLHLSSRAVVVTTPDDQRVLYFYLRQRPDMTYPIALERVYAARSPLAITRVVVDTLFDIVLQYPIGCSIQSRAQCTVAEFIAHHTEQLLP